MFYVKVGDSAIVYTGDYNMTPDRHLGAAQIDRLDLDLLITESATYIFITCFLSCFNIYYLLTLGGKFPFGVEDFYMLICLFTISFEQVMNSIKSYNLSCGYD